MNQSPQQTQTTEEFATENRTSEERVLFVPEIEAFGGGERVYLALLRFLYQRDVAHRLASYYQTIDLVSYADWALPVASLNPPRNPFLKAAALKKWFEKSKHRRPPILMDLQAALHAGAMGLSNYSVIILDTPSLLGDSKVNRTWVKKARDAVFARIIGRGLRRANCVLTNTNYLADEIEQLYGVRPQISNPGAPGNPRDYAYRPPTKQRPFRLISVCRLENSKRIDWILDSLSVLERETPALHQQIDWRLDIVGTGSQQNTLEKMAAQAGIAERVLFHGHVSDAELEQIYSEADLFLMPAVQGYGLPALEALTHKMPVLMHRESGVSEILAGSPWVEIIDGDKDSLTQGLRLILQRAQSGELEHQAMPAYPTEESWAEDICRKCKWLA